MLAHVEVAVTRVVRVPANTIKPLSPRAVGTTTLRRDVDKDHDSQTQCRRAGQKVLSL